MCGIAGIVNLNNQSVNKSKLTDMLAVQKHRGPDHEGYFFENNVGLGFVRLSIIDLSSNGNQPMVSDNGNYIIIFNGEIFNYIELREELINEGVKFKTQTDTEVLLNAFIHWGENCLHKFNGMWSFVIFNKAKKSLFVSRDRFGIKPFYYFLDGNCFIFASEIPAILKVLKEKPRANYSSIFEYLVYNRTDQTENTFFQGIKKLQHGHLINIELLDNNYTFSLKKWYNLADNLKPTFANPKEFLDLFTSSLYLRLRSDVPLGVCFSGGLDSSCIVSLLLKNWGKIDLKTFSAIYNKNDLGDESEFIFEYKDQIKNMYFITPSAESFLKDLDKFLTTHSEPLPTTSIYAQYKVMELAKDNIKVTLDGQGADEQLGGYHYFFGLYFKELLFTGKIFTLLYELISYMKVHKSLYGVKTFFYFLLPKVLKKHTRIKEKGYIDDSFIKENKNQSMIAENLYSASNLKSALIDHFEFKLEHLLKWEDNNSMRFSIEARIPFLDHRIVERSLNIPSNKLFENGVSKSILRIAMKDIIPTKIIERQDKVGFETPEGAWFRTPLFQTFILEIINSKSFQERKIIVPEKARKLYAKHLNKEIDISKEIWKWVNLELWFRKYID